MKQQPPRWRLVLSVLPLLNRHLSPILGWRRLLFIVRLFASSPRYARQFSRLGEDLGAREFKKTFLLVGALYHELRSRMGEARAYETTFAFLTEVANQVQRRWYLPPPSTPRSWERFHSEHKALMEHGLIRHNEHDTPVESADQVRFHITRCRFRECFRDMEIPALAEAFCRSDETVFNEYSPEMYFHRGPQAENTIVRGAPRCTFIFERRR